MTGSPKICFAVTACHKDMHYARILLTSLNYFHPDVPVIVILDGPVKYSELRSAPNLHRVYRTGDISATKGLDLRGLLSVLNFFFFDEFEYYVRMDADSALVGSVLDKLKEKLPIDFLSLDGRRLDLDNPLEGKIFKHYAFDPSEIKDGEPDSLNIHNLLYFSGGHHCFRRNIIWRHEIIKWREHLSVDFSNEKIFKFGDQGFLNYVVNKYAQQGKILADALEITINGKSDPGIYPDINRGNLLKRIESEQKIIHWTGLSRRLTYKAHNFGWALQEYEKMLYRRCGASALIADKFSYYTKYLSNRIKKSPIGRYFA